MAATAGWNDRRLEEALYGPAPRHVYENCKPAPDFAQLHEELQRHRHLTLQLVWEEYKQAHPDGYAYSRFCDLYRRWRQHLDVVLRPEYKAGEKLFVDYAGDTIPIHDPQGGPQRPASIFVSNTWRGRPRACSTGPRRWGQRRRSCSPKF